MVTLKDVAEKAEVTVITVSRVAPGIPQVYYVGLLAGENDIALMEETKNGRNINRNYYGLEEIENEVKRPVVKNLLKLMKFRNEHPAFAKNTERGSEPFSLE